MKILQVIPVFSDSFGGPVTVVRSIAKELAKRHDVTVFTTTAIDSKHDSESRISFVDGYKVFYFARSLKSLCYSDVFGQLNLSYQMLKAIKKHLPEFDLVHVHSWQQFPDILVHKYAKMYHIPYILQLHGSLPNILAKRKLKHVFDINFGRKLLQDASMVIATCQLEARQYKEANVPEEKIAVIYNSLIESQFANLPLRGSLRKRLGLSESQKIILYIGRIHKIKGIDILVKSFLNIISEFESAKLLIIGPDDGYLQELKVLISALKLEKNIILLNPLYGRDKIEAYVDADVCVCPSNYEIFGMTILEACACGKPVIATDVSGVAPEIIVNYKTGFLIKPNDQISLTESLRFILLNEVKSQEIGRNARASALSHFTSKDVIVQLENLYQKVSNDYLK